MPERPRVVFLAQPTIQRLSGLPETPYRRAFIELQPVVNYFWGFYKTQMECEGIYDFLCEYGGLNRDD